MNRDEIFQHLLPGLAESKEEVVFQVVSLLSGMNSVQAGEVLHVARHVIDQLATIPGITA